MEKRTKIRDQRSVFAMRGLRVAAVIGFAVLASLALAQQAPPYRDPALSIDDRVRDLISRMTLEEKVAQITGGRRADHLGALFQAV